MPPPSCLLRQVIHDERHDSLSAVFLERKAPSRSASSSASRGRLPSRTPCTLSFSDGRMRYRMLQGAPSFVTAT